jgi:hypothetical protein
MRKTLIFSSDYAIVKYCEGFSAYFDFLDLIGVIFYVLLLVMFLFILVLI